MDASEEAGEQLLALLLAKVRGFTSLPGAEAIFVIADNVRCKVPGCKTSAIFRCSSGWRYCADHVRVHGPGMLERHSFDVIRTARPQEVADAGVTLQRRAEARDYGAEKTGHP